MVDAADDMGVGVELAAVGGQEDVPGVVVGGENDRRGLVDSGGLHGLQVRRVTDHHLVRDLAQLELEGAILVEDRHLRLALPERSAHGAPDRSAPDHEYRRIGVVVDHEERIELGELLLAAHHHGHAALGEHRFGPSGHQPAPLPHRDDVQAGELAQARFADRSARKRRSVERELREDQLLEVSDSIGRLGAHGHATRELLAEPLLHQDHPRRAAQLEHVHRVHVFGERDHGHVGGDLAHGQGDVGVVGVAEVGDHEPGVGDAHGLVGGALVACAGDHAAPVSVQRRSRRGVGLDDDVGDAVLVEPLDQGFRDLVVATQDHVTFELRIHLAGCAQVDLRLEPRRIEEPDDRERRDDQEHHDPGEQDHDREAAAEIALERDVAEAQRAHHGERPVEAREP